MTMISPTDQPARRVAPAPAAPWPSESAEDRLCALAHELRGGLHILTLNTNLMLDRTRTDDEGVPSTWLADRLRRHRLLAAHRAHARLGCGLAGVDVDPAAGEGGAGEHQCQDGGEAGEPDDDVHAVTGKCFV